MYRLVMPLLWILYYPFTAYSQSESDTISIQDIFVEIDELVIDETISKNGRDFYELFYTNWKWPTSDQSFVIYIKERPFRATTTQISVYLNETKVFEQFLQPRYDFLVGLSEQAGYYVTQYILAYNDIIDQLEGDDMAGTGIF